MKKAKLREVLRARENLEEVKQESRKKKDSKSNKEGK